MPSPVVLLAMLQQEGWEVGGETSGHLLCLDKSTTGDGIVAALEVLAVVRQSGKRLVANAPPQRPHGIGNVERRTPNAERRTQGRSLCPHR